MLDLLDVELDLLACHALQVLAELVHSLPALADDHAGLGGVQRHLNLVGRTLYLDAGKRRARELLADHFAYAHIFLHQVGVVAVRVPARLPFFVYS